MIGQIRGVLGDGSVYAGWRKALLPTDLILSLLAKRSYPLYRLWFEYGKRTEPWFGVPHGSAADDATGRLRSELDQSGYASRPSGASPAQIAEARTFVLGLADRVRARAARDDAEGRQDPFRFDEDGIVFELGRTSRRIRTYFSREALARPGVPALVREHLDLPWARAAATAYFGTDQLLAGSPYYMAEIVDVDGPIEPWHIDCVRPTTKVYLTLNEVTADNAPLRYLPGTHHVDEARHRLFYEICRGGLGAAYFERQDCEAFDRQCVTLTVPEGTFLMFDNRGVHAGSACRRGIRILLATGYRPATTSRLNPRMFPDPHPTPYPWERNT